MDINIISECTNLSLAGKITFFEVVLKLTATGVERYIADLIGKQKLYYDNEGNTYTSPLVFDAPEVRKEFNMAAVKNAITDIQQQHVKYPEFLHHIMEAGCCHYEVFITGKKAIYFGRDGSHHIENFPTRI
jgi:uncharacterized protein YbcV (DUF1398 family)